ncbi:FtsB family cell division protein [Thermobifida halotolerans]|uniref:FtsB family cell division protein n=1 Tax=Thermobifida halotolerans TaxID=483545 RepID=UPI001F174D87|nr:septum formation initiator family protein [Thermobifida halotolerans]
MSPPSGSGGSPRRRSRRTADATAPRDRGGSGAEPTGRPALTSRAAILALLVCVIALSLAYPLREYIAQRAQIAQLKEERAHTRQAVQELAERYEELQDPAHIEREARSRLHYQYPDEQAYILLGETSEEEEVEDSGPREPWFVELWDSVAEADRPDA